jgi:uncharacterized protein
MEVMSRAAALDLPGWYLTAGCLFQTVWNVLTDPPPTYRIKDYDLFYFDDSDLSWEAEDKIIQAAKTIFCEVAPTVEIRNEARVHLWYEHHFGVPCTPYTCTEAAIDSFAATTCCLGVRLEPAGHWRIYAPPGFSDVFNLVVRPNPVLAPRHVYETKTQRWVERWPELTVLPWPDITR